MFCTLKAVGVDFGQRVGCGVGEGGCALGVLSCREGGIRGCVQ